MALTTQTMTDEQRKSVALEYLKAFDNGGVTSTGGSILDLFADDAQVYFPKWGLANGKEEIGKCFGEVGGIRRLPEALQMDAAQNDPRFVGASGHGQGFGRQLQRRVILAQVVEAPCFGERVGRACRCADGEQDGD